ncbi:MAG: 4Fe-4S dicluster domain-containing protein [bacterium]
MSKRLDKEALHIDFRSELEVYSGETIERCYQCGKCTAGCPVAFTMDLGPSRLIRYLQLGFIDEVLSSNTYWICASCYTCATRCPREIEIADLMDGLRNIAFKKDIKPIEPSVRIFTIVFLETVKRFGRMFELAFILFNNILSFKPFRDVFKAPRMFIKGKISLFPSRFDGSGRAWEIIKKWKKI